MSVLNFENNVYPTWNCIRSTAASVVHFKVLILHITTFDFIILFNDNITILYTYFQLVNDLFLLIYRPSERYMNFTFRKVRFQAPPQLRGLRECSPYETLLIERSSPAQLYICTFCYSFFLLKTSLDLQACTTEIMKSKQNVKNNVIMCVWC